MSKLTITIVGTGNVGSALARNALRHGVAVQLAGLDLAKTQAAATQLGAGARAVELATLREGVDFVFLAVPAEAAPAALAAAGQLPDRTIIVDCTNPIRWDNGPVSTAPPEGSTTAQLAARFPRLRVLKSFNTFGAEFHDRPELAGAPTDLYLAGDDGDAKQQLAALARTLGYTAVDVGPLRNAAHLESLAILWIHLATVGQQTRDFAFQMIRRPA
jgi:predicted dinucleotide-binding enzyme